MCIHMVRGVPHPSIHPPVIVQLLGMPHPPRSEALPGQATEGGGRAGGLMSHHGRHQTREKSEMRKLYSFMRVLGFLAGWVKLMTRAANWMPLLTHLHCIALLGFWVF